MIPTEPGIYHKLTMPEYLAIRALSSGVAQTLIDECPAAAWHASPFNADREADDTEPKDVGSIAHQMLLEPGGARICEVIDPADHVGERGGVPDGWTNKSIRAARDYARASGKIPVLKPLHADILDMHMAALAYIKGFDDPRVPAMFEYDGGESEVTMIWDEDGVLCKLRADRISTSRQLTLDYKTSAMCVEPGRWGRTQLVAQGYYFGAAWYQRGIFHCTGVDTEYIFLNQESKNKPHLCSICGVPPDTLALGHDKVGVAIAAWRKCAKSGIWPRYPNRICYPELPPWELTRWTERQAQAEAGIDYGSQA